MMRPIILAIDFDDTIVKTNWPYITGFRRGAKKYINKLYKEGYQISVWTCRTDKDNDFDATDAFLYLKENDVNFHRLNENHPALCKRFGNDSRKIAADIYIDDKGVWPFGFPSWFVLYWLIRFKSLSITPKKRILSFCKPEHFY